MKAIKTLSIATLIGASAVYAQTADQLITMEGITDTYVTNTTLSTYGWAHPVTTSGNSPDEAKYLCLTSGEGKSFTLTSDISSSGNAFRVETGSAWNAFAPALYVYKNSTATLSGWGSVSYLTNGPRAGLGLVVDEGASFTVDVNSEFASTKGFMYAEYGLCSRSDVYYGDSPYSAQFRGTVNVWCGIFNLRTTCEMKDGVPISPSLYQLIDTKGVLNIGSAANVVMNNVMLKGTINFVGKAESVSFTRMGPDNDLGALIVDSNSAVIGLYGENSISKNYTDNISFANSDSKLTFKVGGDALNQTFFVESQEIPVINAFGGATMVIDATAERNVDSPAQIALAGIVSDTGVGTFNLEINGFENDFVYFEEEYAVSSDGKIVLDSGLVVQLSGTNLNGDALANDWAIENVDGKYFLQNSSVVPEAADIAVIFGAIAFAFVAYRRRK